MSDLRRAKVVLGVSGGIAAYKAASLLRLFTESGHDVTVVPTAAALQFVGAPTWAALSGKPVHSDVWSAVDEVPHVRLGKEADLVVVAPATADLIARAAAGRGDDLLTTTLLTARCPVVFAPAMHTEMWEHPATVANIATLIARGVHVIPPASGRLTGTDTGPGRLPEPEEIFTVCRRLLAQSEAPGAQPAGSHDLSGRHVVVSAGGTREPLDPVRFLGNRSSGKQGYAVAARAVARGARVTLVSAHAEIPVPRGVEIRRVGTALEMGAALVALAPQADVVVMAAAVADFRPAAYAPAKIKKAHGPGQDDAAPTITLVRNPDILAGLVQARGERTTPIIVGFAAETGDAETSVLELGREKLARKGCDLLVVNEVGVDKTFGADENTIHLLRAGSEAVIDVGPAPKDVIAEAILDEVAASLGPSADRSAN